ncbi:hypothetical protein JB92DRAFT_2955038 [Gautieria morchelliformis]|nr:hypothetical protein JB92DRAFT_2955038 [Gautieria morchelliformis]
MGEADLSGPQLTHDNSLPHLLRPFPPIRSYAADQSPIPCPLPNEHCVFDEFNGLSPAMWDAPSEQEHFFNGSLVHSFPPPDFGFAPETFSPGLNIPYPANDNSYARMFRGRKSKSASEVLDELRPYACDICQAAFARSHDRDREYDVHLLGYTHLALRFSRP